jgi:hypothetical protein
MLVAAFGNIAVLDIVFRRSAAAGAAVSRIGDPSSDAAT